MKLIFENFESFLNSVEKITSKRLMEAKSILQNEGRDIDNISDIFINSSGEFFYTLPDGSFIKVNLYIATKEVDRYEVDSITSADLYRYHIYKCSTITNMFNTGRKDRYKMNIREDGTFHYKLHDFRGNLLKEVENQKLNICKNCLKKFLHTEPSDNDVRNFNLKNFHKQNNSFFDFDTSKLEKGENAKPNVYSRKWNEISTQVKTKRDYICENCTWKPNSDYQKRFVHTHHQNGDKTNNTKDNLKVLCIKCHANVDGYHSRIKSQDNYKEFISIK